MPQINYLVDATVGHPLMSFLDAFQGYHQIPLALSDQEKTAFVTPIGNYPYKVMPFGLKNAGSTYQRMMTRMFKPVRTYVVYLLRTLVFNPRNARDHFMNIFKSITEDIFK